MRQELESLPPEQPTSERRPAPLTRRQFHELALGAAAWFGLSCAETAVTAGDCTGYGCGSYGQGPYGTLASAA